jgi:ribosomal protein S18 acetylase RimI-like enzyme
MKIRPLQLGDREQIRHLLERQPAFNEKERRLAVELVDESLKFPEKHDYLIYCAVDGSDKVAGYICFGPNPVADEAYDLYWIVVDEPYSRQGLGGRLLEEMESIGRAAHIRRVYIETSSTNGYRPARSFYGKKGYRRICTLKDFYRAGDHKVIYMKELNERGCISS